MPLTLKAHSGRIFINEKQAKPSKDVKVGDVVNVSFGDREITFRILSIDERQTKQSATEMYEIISNTTEEK